MILILLVPFLVFGCTIGAFSPRVTREGVALLWKNRDVSNPDQAVRYFNDGQFGYLGLVYAGEPARVWGGVNEVGFGIINANSANLGGGPLLGIDDGELMKLALANCATVADFQHLLDSTNKVLRSVNCNFGVMDSSGAAAMFEAGADFYVRIDADSLPEGYVVRANFSLCRDTTGQASYRRYARAVQLADEGAVQGGLGLGYVVRRMARDLGAVGFDPYPLPYQGTLPPLPAGYLPTTNTINRRTTRSAIFIAGVRPGVDPSLSTMWLLLGEPVVATLVPLWPRAREAPSIIVDRPKSELCRLAQRLRDRCYNLTSNADAIDTRQVAEIRNCLDPVEELVFSETMRELESWRAEPPYPESCAQFQQELADLAFGGNCSYLFRLLEDLPRRDSCSDSGFRIQPDLVTGAVTVFFPGDTRNRMLCFRDALGRALGEIDLTKGDGCLQGSRVRVWSPGRLSPGIYYVTLERQGDRATLSFAHVN